MVTVTLRIFILSCVMNFPRLPLLQMDMDIDIDIHIHIAIDMVMENGHGLLCYQLSAKVVFLAISKFAGKTQG